MDSNIAIGCAEARPDDIYSLNIRRNLTVLDADTAQPVLQRFGPRRRHLYYNLVKDIRAGRKLFDEVLNTCTPKNNSGTGYRTLDREENNGHYPFGIWYGRGSRYLSVSQDTRQNDERERLSNVLVFMIWLRKFVTTHVRPLIDTTLDLSKSKNVDREHAVHAVFRDELLRRQDDYSWLCGEVPAASDLCHPLYHMCSPFRGFTGNPHPDQDDASPTILLNFGFARLCLPEYHTTIDLRPGEVILFNARIWHFTIAHPKYPGPLIDRWGISCLFSGATSRATATV